LILALNNKIKGWPRFHKITYILKNMGINFKYKFSYHYFGPYSSDLQLELEELLDCNIVVKEKISHSILYRVSDQYKAIINTDLFKDKIILLNYLNSQDLSILELIATIYYLINTGIKNEKVLHSKLCILRPDLHQYEINKALRLKTHLSKNYHL